MRLLILTILTLWLFNLPAAGQGASPQVLDDFESYPPDTLPTRWKYLDEGDIVPLAPEHMRTDERFYVTEEAGNRALRVYTQGEAVHLTMLNEPEGFDWDFRVHPRLSWDWRALEVPEGGREDQESLNDTPAAVYVIFAMDGLLFKRPRAIKYAYSATLPVGSVVDYGKLKVIVVSTAADGSGDWKHIDRDVVGDYRLVFGGDPPPRPLSIRLWGDSDNTNTVAEAEFDNLMLLGPAGS